MKTKKIIADILALAVVGGTVSSYSGRQAERTVCITAYGESETSGVYNGFEYTIGSTYDWSIKDYVDCAIITGADDTVVGDISVPDEINGIKVTEIQDNAFNGNENITSVVIPDSVTDIGSWAFSGCSNLKSVTLPEKLHSINNSLFCDCTSLVSVNIPESVSDICGSAFENCSSLLSVDIPESVTWISYCAFENCSSLETVTFHESENNLSISTEVFRGCSSLKSVTIPGNVSDIQIGTFQDCTSLVSVQISSGVKEIDEDAFSGCINLTVVSIPDTLNTIGENAFAGTLWLKNKQAENPLVAVNGIIIDGSGYTGELIIPDDVKAIAGGAFRGSEITSLVYPGSINEIGDKAFADCSKLSSVVIEEGVKWIRDSAFSGCTALESISIPDSVLSIDWYFVENCPNLKEINVGENNERYNSIDGVLFSGTTLKVYPEGKEGAYTVPDGTKRIGDLAFKNCTKLTSIDIPASVEYFWYSNWYATLFDGCTSLEEVSYSGSSPDFKLSRLYSEYTDESQIPPVFNNLPDGPVYLGTALVGYNGSPEGKIDITVKDGTKVISNEAFWGIEVGTINVPASVLSIGYGAFNCIGLTDVNVDEGNPVYSSDNGVLYKNNGQILVLYPANKKDTSYIVPDGTNVIYGDAFMDNRYIEEVSLPDSLRLIGNSAFSGCTSLKNVDMPKRLQYLGMNAFSSCQSLTEITVPQGVTDLNYNELSNCSELKTVDIPASISYLPCSWGFLNTPFEKIIIRNPECTVSEVPEGAVICGYEGSQAQIYAEENGYTFESLGEAPVVETVYGDADLDGKVGISDVVKVMMYVSNKDANYLDEQQLLNADVYNSGDGVFIADALSIQKKVAQRLCEKNSVKTKTVIKT